MNTKHWLILLICAAWLFLLFSNAFVEKSSAVSVSQTPLRVATPIQTMTIQTPFPLPKSPPKIKDEPTRFPAAGRAMGQPDYRESNTNNANSQTPTPKPVDTFTSTPTPTPTPIQTPTPKISPLTSPTEAVKTSDGSWLPWIIAGILLAVVIFLLGRNSKE